MAAERTVLALVKGRPAPPG